LTTSARCVNRKVCIAPNRVDFLTTIVDTCPYTSCDLRRWFVPMPPVRGEHMPKTDAVVWDRHAINAEIKRRGMNLTGIATDAGLYASACRQGIIGMSRPGAEAIAKALNIPFRTLFPDMYSRGRHYEADNIRNGSRDGSAKGRSGADTARRAS
jgi:lambda repressor-like predicted transcriptional regulator